MKDAIGQAVLQGKRCALLSDQARQTDLFLHNNDFSFLLLVWHHLGGSINAIVRLGETGNLSLAREKRYCKLDLPGLLVRHESLYNFECFVRSNTYHLDLLSLVDDLSRRWHPSHTRLLLLILLVNGQNILGWWRYRGSRRRNIRIRR